MSAVDSLRVAVTGSGGRMGRTIVPALEREPGIAVVALISRQFPASAAAEALPVRCSDPDLAFDLARPQVVVDFSSPAFAVRVVLAAHARGIFPVVGTTGFSQDQLSEIAASCERSGLPAVVAPNFSLGATVLARLAREAARYFPAVEVVESHHDGKRDSPSGTALRLCAALAASRPNAARVEGDHDASRGRDVEGIRVHSLRLPGLVAHHEVVFGGQGEYLTLRHDSTSRECFVPGLLLAIRRVVECRGLVLDLDALL